MLQKVEWPSAVDIGFMGGRSGSRTARARVYNALCKGALTIDDIRKIAWIDGRPRNDESINVLLNRMQRQLIRHGIIITRGVGADKFYRLARC